jgi:hypothetical protein
MVGEEEQSMSRHFDGLLRKRVKTYRFSALH